MKNGRKRRASAKRNKEGEEEEEERESVRFLGGLKMGGERRLGLYIRAGGGG